MKNQKVSLIILMVFFGCSSPAEANKPPKVNNTEGQTAETTLSNPELKDLNLTVKFQETRAGVMVRVKGQGLPPRSRLGMHVHENGICESPTFKSAGDHFNPHKKPHGSPGEANRHLGDLGNITVNGKGAVSEEFLVTRESKHDFSSLAGKAVILHSKTDDFKTQPSGDSGDRIACGIIQL